MTDDQAGVFDIKLQDKDLLELVRSPISDAKDYWDNQFGLRKAREDNMKLWLPKHNEDKTYYDYQEENLYQEPRVFVSTETICAIVNSRIPMPTIAPAQDTQVSTDLADDVRQAMYAYTSKYQVQDIFRVSTRNLVLKRSAFIKLRYDKSVGKNGEIVTEMVMPEDIIVDKDAVWGSIPRFIAQVIRNKTYDELIAMFPDSKQKILEMAGCQRVDSNGDLVAYKSQLAKKKDLYEIWFSYFEDGKYQSGVMVTDTDCQYVLYKQKNPNWNYEEEDGVTANILDNPEPPFITFNYLNDGSSYIDPTSITEQAATMQRIVDKRGFQIMENADQAGSGLVYNTTMITKAEIAQLVGSPDERVGVKGNVNEAVTRLTPPMLPAYVFQDKIDARMQIDDIYGTHDVSRGKQSGNKTLGQDQLQISQDYTRIDDLSRAIMRSAIKYYRYLAQMMKVYYTEEHWFKATGEDGQYDFIMMKNDLIEDGIDITVEEGSNMPLNHGEQMEFAANLARLGLIDPLSIYEIGSGMPMPNPKKMIERLMIFKTDPMAYAGLADAEEVNRYAMADIMILNNGEMPKLRNEITPSYLDFFTKYMMSADYIEAVKRKPEIEQMYQAYLVECQRIAEQQIRHMESQMPTQQELDVQAQKQVQNAQMANQMTPKSEGQAMPQNNNKEKPIVTSQNKESNVI